MEQEKNENQNGVPTLDVYQTENEIVIKSAIAGVSGKNLDIAVTGDKITIKGTRESEAGPGKEYVYRELFWGPFERMVLLPEEVDADKAKASLKNGILTITLPRINKGKKLEIA